jgi:uncharacterized protein with HEPN domain
MEKHRCRDFLLNILEAISEIELLIGDKTLEQFTADKTVQTITLQSIEIIAKATRLIPDYIKKVNPDFPWQKMAALSDELAIAYLEFDTKNLYKTAKETIPPLKVPIEKILKNKPNTINKKRSPQ